MPRVGIALGSNLGDRLANLREATLRLRAIADDSKSVREASIYETAPELCPPGSPDFLNTVVEIGYEGTARDLLLITREIERDMGRDGAAPRNASRIIDLDILYFGEDVCSHPDLRLPHPRLAQRRFVLEPLAEIRPDLSLPGFQKTAAEMLADLGENHPPLLRIP